MNRRLFFKIYDHTLNNEAVKKAAVFLTEASKPVYVFFYGLGFLLLIVRHSADVKGYIIVPFAVLVVNTVLRKVLNKPRPFVREGIERLVSHEENGSFPSNHAASSMIIAFSWLWVYPPIGVLLMVLALFTGMSRVMTGVHYPLDVLCGWAVAAIGGLIGTVV